MSDAGNSKNTPPLALLIERMEEEFQSLASAHQVAQIVADRHLGVEPDAGSGEVTEIDDPSPEPPTMQRLHELMDQAVAIRELLLHQLRRLDGM